MAHTTMTQTWKEELICEDQAILTRVTYCLLSKGTTEQKTGKDLHEAGRATKNC